MKLKIGRHEYDITNNDSFMDNGACVQLLSQSKEKSYCGSKLNPVLSKRAIREIAEFDRVQKMHGFGLDVTVFGLKI